MATRKKSPARRAGVLIDVARFVSASQDPSTSLLLATGLAALAVRRRQVGPRGTL